MPRYNIDLEKVIREKVEPGLTPHEAGAMGEAVKAAPLRALLICLANKVHWYLFNPRRQPARVKHHGVADTMQQAQTAVSEHLDSTENVKVVTL